MVGCLRHADQRAQAEPVRVRLDRAVLRLQPVDLDQALRTHDVELHEVEQVGAAGQVLHPRPRVGFAAAKIEGAPRVFGPFQGEGTHQPPSPPIWVFAISTASTIFG